MVYLSLFARPLASLQGQDHGQAGMDQPVKKFVVAAAAASVACRDEAFWPWVFLRLLYPSICLSVCLSARLFMSRRLLPTTYTYLLSLSGCMHSYLGPANEKRNKEY